MERENDTADLIELGTASTLTKGVIGKGDDLVLQAIPIVGLTDD